MEEKQPLCSAVAWLSSPITHPHFVRISLQFSAMWSLPKRIIRGQMGPYGERHGRGEDIPLPFATTPLLPVQSQL